MNNTTHRLPTRRAVMSWPVLHTLSVAYASNNAACRIDRPFLTLELAHYSDDMWLMNHSNGSFINVNVGAYFEDDHGRYLLFPVQWVRPCNYADCQRDDCIPF